MPIINSAGAEESTAAKSKPGRRRPLRVNDQIEVYDKDQEQWRTGIVIGMISVDTFQVSFTDSLEIETLQNGFFRYRFSEVPKSSSSRLSSSSSSSSFSSSSSSSSSDQETTASAAPLTTPTVVQPEVSLSSAIMAAAGTTTTASTPKGLRLRAMPESKRAKSLDYYNQAKAALPPYLGEYTEQKEAEQQADNYNWNSLYPR